MGEKGGVEKKKKEKGEKLCFPGEIANLAS